MGAITVSRIACRVRGTVQLSVARDITRLVADMFAFLGANVDLSSVNNSF